MGLPLEGSCPECGQAYDKTSRMGIASHAAAAAERGDRVAMLAKVGILSLLGLAAFAMGGVGAYAAPDWKQPVLIAGVVGGGLFLMAFLVWLLEYMERREP